MIKNTKTIAIATAATVAAGALVTVGGVFTAKALKCNSLENRIVSSLDNMTERLTTATTKISPDWTAKELDEFGATLEAPNKVDQSNFDKAKSEWKASCISSPADKSKRVVAAVERTNKANQKYIDTYKSAAKPFRPDKAWNSPENRAYLENSILTNTVRVDTQKPVNVSSTACSAQTTPNFWNCNVRELGSSYGHNTRVEVNPKTGIWQTSGW